MQMNTALDPGVRSEAFHRVMVELAARSPLDHDASGLSASGSGPTLTVVWAVRLAELAATYLAVLDEMASTSMDCDVDLDEAIERSVAIWRSHGWLVGPQDALTQVVVSLAKEAVRGGGRGRVSDVVAASSMAVN